GVQQPSMVSRGEIGDTWRTVGLLVDRIRSREKKSRNGLSVFVAACTWGSGTGGNCDLLQSWERRPVGRVGPIPRAGRTVESGQLRTAGPTGGGLGTVAPHLPNLGRSFGAVSEVADGELQSSGSDPITQAR